MTITRLKPALETISGLGLTKRECQSVEKEALRLMVHGQAACVVQHDDEVHGTCIEIYSDLWDPWRAHVVRRRFRTYFVLDPDLKPLVVSRDFGRVLEAVKSLG